MIGQWKSKMASFIFILCWLREQKQILLLIVITLQFDPVIPKCCCHKQQPTDLPLEISLCVLNSAFRPMIDLIYIVEQIIFSFLNILLDENPKISMSLLFCIKTPRGNLLTYLTCKYWSKSHLHKSLYMFAFLRFSHHFIIVTRKIRFNLVGGAWPLVDRQIYN